MVQKNRSGIGSTDNDWLLPNLIDHLSRSKPRDILYKFPTSSSAYTGGFTDVTYESFANAVNGAAHWLERKIGRNDNDEVLAYLGPSDFRYMVFIVAALKVGYVLLLISPRESIAVQQHLLESTTCEKLISSFPDPTPVASLVDSTNIALFQAPQIDELLHGRFEEYPFDKSFDENKRNPFLILHSSGSTGSPKPVRYTHEFAASVARVASLPPPEGYQSIYDLFKSRQIFSVLPNFHIAGIHMNLLLALSNAVSIAMPLDSRPPTASDLPDALHHLEAYIVVGSPSLCHELAENPDILDTVASQVAYLTFGGGGCPSQVGDKVAEKLKLFTIMGSTEVGGQCLIKTSGEWHRDEWKYIQPHPAWISEFRHYYGDLYEQWFVKGKDHRGSDTIFKIFPDKSEISSKDLYSPHPTKRGLWTHKGRIDDIIVFLNGEKTNPIQFESTVSSHPDISAALLVGAQRSQAALLIEPTTAIKNFRDQAAFIEKIWPAIEQANANCPGHAKVVRSHVMLTRPDKSMRRAGKGTIQRQATLSLYEEQIEDLYQNAQQQSIDATKEPRCVSELSSGELANIVRHAVTSVMERELKVDEELSSHGLDSLQAAQLTQSIKAEVDCAALVPSVVYTNGTIEKLTSTIQRLDQERFSSLNENRDARRQQIRDSFQAHEQEMGKISLHDNHRTTRHVHNSGAILLTGSTGAIGSYLLQQFINIAPRRRIFCLNRSANSEKLQKERNESRGLPTTWEAEQVTFLTGDLTAPRFGLTPDQFADIERNVTEVVHAAWPVNFNLPLPSFHVHLSGIVKLVAFASRHSCSSNRLRITFLSSISSVHGLASSEEFKESKVPERSFTDPATPGDNGYAASKHVAELLLIRASEQFNIPCSILRIGQIAGPSAAGGRGVWAAQEWLPSLVISSVALGVVPRSLGPEQKSSDTAKLADVIDWIPIDELAGIIVELIGGNVDSSPSQEAGANFEIFHLVNPAQTTWSDLLPTVINSVDAHKSQRLEKISLRSWVAKLKALADKNLGTTNQAKDVVAKAPGIKLLDFYTGLLDKDDAKKGSFILDTAAAQRRSSKLKDIGPITSKQMETWVDGWMRLL